MISYGEPTKKCLNDDSHRKLDVSFVTGVQEFDESSKQVKLTINVDIKDHETKEPFDTQLRRLHFSGINITETQDSDGNYQVDNFDTTENRLMSIPNFLINLWPFETYTIPMFLEFNSDVKLCYDDYEKGEDDIHSYKAGYFPENPNWDVDIHAKEIPFSELEQLSPGIKSTFENPTIFQFDTIIYHPDVYKVKNILYFIVSLIPILLIIAHALFFRSGKLEVHVAFFTGVTILILTSLFAIKSSTPIDLTLLEILSLSSIAVYSVGFFVFLYKYKKRNSIKEGNNHKDGILNKKSPDRDKIWKNFTKYFAFLMISLVIAFTASSWYDTTSIVSKIADVVSVIGVFLSIYIAVWVYKVEMNKKDEKTKENEYYKINVNDNLYSLGSHVKHIFNFDAYKENLSPSEKTKLCNEIHDKIEERRNYVLSVGNELQIFNMNLHIPAEAKDMVYGIIKESRKTVSSYPTLDSLSEDYAVANGVLNKIEQFFDSEYMGDLETLRAKYTTISK